MTGVARMQRTRGGLSGLLLILLGACGGLVPFIGPYFHYAYTPDKAWIYNSGRLWLSVVPGAVAAIGGLIVLATSIRPVAVLGAVVAAAGGAWLVVGVTIVALIGRTASISPGLPAGGTIRLHLLEQLGFFSGLGVVIVFFAAIALGRCTVISARDGALGDLDTGLETDAAGYPHGDPFGPADLGPPATGSSGRSGPGSGGDYPTSAGGLGSVRS